MRKQIKRISTRVQLYLGLAEGIQCFADISSAEVYEPSRICPGRFFADAGLWLMMACILACFDILPPLDENGKEVMPPAEFTSGTTR